MTVTLEQLTLAELRALARWYGLTESHDADTLRTALRSTLEHQTDQTPPNGL